MTRLWKDSIRTRLWQRRKGALISWWCVLFGHDYSDPIGHQPGWLGCERRGCTAARQVQKVVK